MQQIDIALGKLVVSALNVRKDLHAGQEDSGINELASSIRQRGLLSPLIVRRTADGRYEVLVGQRRLLACCEAGLDPVPCLLRDDLDDADALTLSLVENVHRADMHPLDKAHALKALFDRHQSCERLAKETGWSASTVRKYLRLLELPGELQRRLGTDSGPAGVGMLSRLAQTFAGEEAVDVYGRISGFNQRLQEGILKRSEGDISAIDDLVIEAQECAFDLRQCGGGARCEIVRDILRHRLSQADFQELVRTVARNFDASAEVSNRHLREAARAFWKALAVG